MTWTLMRQTLRVLRGGAVALVILSGCLFGLAGCQQMAAAQAVSAVARTTPQQLEQTAQTTVQNAQNTARTAVQGAVAAAGAIPGVQLALDAIPAWIRNMANNALTSNNLNWGRPKVIYYADGRYIFVYPAPSGLFQANRPRVIVVDTMGRIARLERLQKLGY